MDTLVTDVILCATQRCGSTMIVEDMRNTGVMGTPEEWFVPWTPEKTEINWQDALASVRKRATGENGVMAIKVMANQLHDVEQCLATFTNTQTEGTFPRFYDTFREAHWIKLNRHDVVAQAISRVMSRQTGINHAIASADDEHFAGNLQAGYDKTYNAKAIYRYGAILREVAAISLENLAWDRFFETHGIEPHEFLYEDVSQDDDMTHLDVIAQIIGLDGPLTKTPRKLVKMANQRNQNWRARFFADAAAKKFRPHKAM